MGVNGERTNADVARAAARTLAGPARAHGKIHPYREESEVHPWMDGWLPSAQEFISPLG